MSSITIESHSATADAVAAVCRASAFFSPRLGDKTNAATHGVDIRSKGRTLLFPMNVKRKIIFTYFVRATTKNCFCVTAPALCVRDALEIFSCGFLFDLFIHSKFIICWFCA